MTYFGFLLRFLVAPMIVLLLLTLGGPNREKTIEGFQKTKAIMVGIGLHVILALLYTTPWDNYLVASGVWRYDPQLISGLVIGWVPLEEYTFFVLETITTGLWWWFLFRRTKPDLKIDAPRKLRWISLLVTALIWTGAVAIFLFHWEKGNYLGLILIWALPPIALQLAFGADILWHFRRLLSLVVIPLFLFLSTADLLAISSGTWQINPLKTIGLWVGPLPIEEALFFLMTLILISFGLTLALSSYSQSRWKKLYANLSSRSRFLRNVTGYE